MAKISSISTAVAGAMFALTASMGAQAGEFDGVTVNIMTQTGAIQEPLQRRAPEFEKLTGAKINIIAVPFSDLYQKAADRLGERHQFRRCRGVRAAMDGRLCLRRLS